MFDVLIVEDIEATSDWLASLVTQAFPDAKPTLCHDIKTAQEKVEAKSFALALVDVNLPDGNGLTLIPVIKQKHPHCCVVTMTVLDDAETIFAAIQQGAMGYLLKDQSEEILINKLQHAMNGDPPLSPAIARRMLEHFRVTKPEEPQATSDASVFNLKPREKEILIFISKGFSRTEIAEMISLSPHTVARYVKDIYQKLDVRSRAEAASVATRIGLV